MRAYSWAPWYSLTGSHGARTLQEWVGRVYKLHPHALQGLLSRGNVQQVQDDRLVWPQCSSTSNLWSQRIADLSCTRAASSRRRTAC